jgi:hypothetical protein
VPHDGQWRKDIRQSKNNVPSGRYFTSSLILLRLQKATMTATTMDRNDGTTMEGGSQMTQQLEDKDKPKNEDEHETGIARSTVKKEICRQVLRKKLAKQRHLVVPQAFHPSYLDSLFPETLRLFDPQTVHYNGGVAAVKEWKISCYLEVMDGGIPCTHPNLELLHLYQPLLDECNDMFLYWYRQQHACNSNKTSETTNETKCERIMTFLTRYTPNPGESALLKHVDGAGKVDGSIVVALPVDRWSAPESVNAFEGGGLTFWDGRQRVISPSTDGGSSSKSTTAPCEIHYDTRSGDVAFIDR